MENFSRKEKIALIVLGIILVAIFSQMIWRLGGFNSTSGGGVVINEIGMDFTGDLLKSGEGMLRSSSHNRDHEVVSRLMDADRKSFWHISLDHLGEPAWVMVDFGSGNKKTVRALMALPRYDLPRQFFHKAELFGSDNGEDWELVSEIIQGERPGRAAWRRWTFDNDRQYRYYQLLITDGHEGGKFYSMAELALFE